MWMILYILLPIAAVAILILLAGTAVRINDRGIRLGFRRYCEEDISHHWFLVKVCHKSPAEYYKELNAFIPTKVPPSHKKTWAVELRVFDGEGQFMRTHLLKKPNEHGAETLARELTQRLAPRLMPPP